MTLPRNFRYKIAQNIGGHVNNCALNTILPYILNGIKELAQMEENGTLDDLLNNPIYQSYTHLRLFFQEHYQLNKILKARCSEPGQAFNSFREFDDFLEQFEPGNFLAKEIILAPVLRLFIQNHKGLSQESLEENLNELARMSPADTQRNFQIDDLETHEIEQRNILAEATAIDTSVQSDGRYSMLDGTVAARLFYFPFGIYDVEVTCPTHIAQIKAAPTYLQSVYPFNDGIRPSLKVTLRNDHYEINLVDFGNLNLPEKDVSGVLQEVIVRITSDNSKVTTMRALEYLKQYVQETFCEFRRSSQQRIQALHNQFTDAPVEEETKEEAIQEEAPKIESSPRSTNSTDNKTQGSVPTSQDILDNLEHHENNYFKFNCMSIILGLSGAALLAVAIIFFPPVGIVAAIGLGASYAYGVSIGSAAVSIGAFIATGLNGSGFFKQAENSQDDLARPLATQKSL